MIKRNFFLFAFCCGVMCANATAQYMTVEQKNGERISFLLKENPIITYSEGDLVVNGNATTTYAISGVKNYHFTEDDETKVKDGLSNQTPIISLDDKTINIINAPANAKLSLVNIKGVVVATTNTDSEGTGTITFPEGKGIYVLSIGNHYFKIIRK
ncbi:MAG: T9SS type A sorting domain-containing protein [Paludibacteraceae bacterium]|nr:T9SS type A sorting domain-containing protein [Paludibacteraceae bacterium]